MKGHQFDLDFGVIEIDGKDFMDENEREEEAKKELEIREAESVKRIEEIGQKVVERIDKKVEEKLKKLEEIPTTPIDNFEFYISNALENEKERENGSLALFEKERQMQLDRELEWKKEKEVKRKESEIREKELKIKKIKSRIKTVLVFVILVVIALAMISGYRIIITEGETYSFVNMIEDIKGIWGSATDWFWDRIRSI